MNYFFNTRTKVIASGGRPTGSDWVGISPELAKQLDKMPQNQIVIEFGRPRAMNAQEKAELGIHDKRTGAEILTDIYAKTPDIRTMQKYQFFVSSYAAFAQFLHDGRLEEAEQVINIALSDGLLNLNDVYYLRQVIYQEENSVR